MKLLLTILVLLVSMFPLSLFAAWQKTDVWDPRILEDGMDKLQVENGMTAIKYGKTIVVEIPGSQLDALSGYPVRPLTLQLAAAALVNVCNVGVKSGAEAIDKTFKGSRNVKQGSGDVVTEYIFQLRNKRYAAVFVYLNEVSGLLAVIKMPTNAISNLEKNKE